MVSSSSDVSGPRPVGIHWEYAIPLLAVHLAAALVLIPSLFSWSGLVLALVGTHLFGMLGINICYHRLLTHRSLAVPRWLEQTLATIAIFSLEDSPVRWVATHRLHHAHSDAAADPHSPVHGISWAHTGWLVRPAPDRRTLAFFDRYARDVLAVPYYRWFEKRPMRVLWVYLAQIPLLRWLAGCLASPAETPRRRPPCSQAAGWSGACCCGPYWSGTRRGASTHSLICSAIAIMKPGKTAGTTGSWPSSLLAKAGITIIIMIQSVPACSIAGGRSTLPTMSFCSWHDLVSPVISCSHVISVRRMQPTHPGPARP